MALKVIDLVNDTRRLLLGSHRAEFNRLSSAAGDSDLSIQVEFTVLPIAAGSILGIGDELVYVWQDTTSASVQVQRGFLGSTPAAHVAGALVEMNPRFSQFELKRALVTEIRSWGPPIFHPVATTLTVPAGRRDFDLEGFDSFFYDVLDVKREPRVGSHDWVSVGFKSLRDLEVAEYGSRTAVMLDAPVERATKLRVTVATPIRPPDDFADDLEVFDEFGLRGECADIAAYGAAWRLTAGREVRRTFLESQQDPRDTADVPAGAAMATARSLKALRDVRFAEEARVMRHRYPYRKR